MDQKPLQQIETLKLTLTRGEPLTSVFEPTDPVEVARAFLGEGLDREHFGMLLLDAKEQVTACSLVGIGSLTQTLVHAREVFKAAILSNAVSLILFHNHPSGDPTPSLEDFLVTQELRKIGELIQIPVSDHLILGAGGRFVSLREDFPFEVDPSGRILDYSGQVEAVNEDGQK